MFFENLPRINLQEFPTPLELLPRFGEAIGHPRLYIKRDDVMSIGLGGNKIRNLEFWLGEAKRQNADLILAAGGLQSNQCRLTAAAAAKLGLECVLVHNDTKPDKLEGNQLLNYLFGAKSVFLGTISEQERQIQMELLAEAYREQGRRPYLIGDPGLGAMGYAAAAVELKEQSTQLGIDLKHVVIVGSMCITAAGFAFGTALSEADFHVHIISVEYPLQEMIDRCKTIWEQAKIVCGQSPKRSLEDIASFYDDYLGSGYAIPTRESIKTILLLARLEGILLENVYMAKTLYGLTDLISRGILPPEEAVGFVHTGGIGALFSQSSFFQSQE
ncbi:MAG TPA: pyridoxal-phosphate dependent enzyme [Bacillota bacterium]|nr:pyridoxal-phosphate dependent enzyme [Bacillota bacterium]